MKTFLVLALVAGVTAFAAPSKKMGNMFGKDEKAAGAPKKLTGQWMLATMRSAKDFRKDAAATLKACGIAEKKAHFFSALKGVAVEAKPNSKTAICLQRHPKVTKTEMLQQ